MSKSPIIAVNTKLCIACGACCELAPDIFFINEKNVSQVKQATKINHSALTDAIAVCPTNAISSN